MLRRGGAERSLHVAQQPAVFSIHNEGEAEFETIVLMIKPV